MIHPIQGVNGASACPWCGSHNLQFVEICPDIIIVPHHDLRIQMSIRCLDCGAMSINATIKQSLIGESIQNQRRRIINQLEKCLLNKWNSLCDSINKGKASEQ